MFPVGWNRNLQILLKYYWVRDCLVASDAWGLFQNRCLACRESLDWLFQPRFLHICPNQIFQPDHDDDDGAGDDADADDDGGGGDEKKPNMLIHQIHDVHDFPKCRPVECFALQWQI